MLEGILRFDGKELTSQAFIVDTGADTTLLRYTPTDDFRGIYVKGRADSVQGVGGIWPGRAFTSGWELLVMAEDTASGQENPYSLRLPMVSVMAPFAQQDGKRYPQIRDVGIFAYKEVLDPPRVAPNTRPQIAERLLQKYCRAPHIENLLGLDVFEANRLKLDWDPQGQSAMVSIPAAVPAAVPVVDGEARKTAESGS